MLNLFIILIILIFMYLHLRNYLQKETLEDDDDVQNVFSNANFGNN